MRLIYVPRSKHKMTDQTREEFSDISEGRVRQIIADKMADSASEADKRDAERYRWLHRSAKP